MTGLTIVLVIFCVLGGLSIAAGLAVWHIYRFMTRRWDD